MLNLVDQMLRQLLLTQVPGIVSPLQVRFEPPDDDWRTYVRGLDQLAINIYMVELRENREQRSCGRTRQIDQGIVTETPLPRYVDVQYLITAWDPAKPGPGVEPTPNEHKLLWDITSALMNADPLDPVKIFFPSPVPGGFPPEIANAELPTTILPREGFGKHAEFWGTMPGSNHPWRPAVILVLTLPMTQPQIVTGPIVTTRITEYRISPDTGAVELWAEIGGTVLDSTVAPPVIVSGAWVELVDSTGVQIASTTSDDQGRFIFNMIRPGNYQLRFSAGSRAAPPPRNIAVPSPTGEYNLNFT